MAKQATTIATKVALAALDLAVEMCTRPWIVEFSKNSSSFVDAVYDTQCMLIVLTKPPSVILVQREDNCEKC